MRFVYNLRPRTVCETHHQIIVLERPGRVAELNLAVFRLKIDLDPLDLSPRSRRHARTYFVSLTASRSPMPGSRRISRLSSRSASFTRLEMGLAAFVVNSSSSLPPPVACAALFLERCPYRLDRLRPEGDDALDTRLPPDGVDDRPVQVHIRQRQRCQVRLGESAVDAQQDHRTQLRAWRNAGRVFAPLAQRWPVTPRSAAVSSLRICAAE